MNGIDDFLGLIAQLPLTEPQPEGWAASEASGPVSMLYQSVDTGSLRLVSNPWESNGTNGAQSRDNLNGVANLLQALLGEPWQANALSVRDVSGSGFLEDISAGEPADAPKRIPNPDRMPYFDQGNTNGCGSTSLAMVLNYYGINVSPQDVDKVIRRTDNSIGATPEDEIQFARDHGLDAEEYNNGSWEEVKSMIDQGYPVMASVTGQNMPEIPSGSLPNGRHQIVITGYEKGADGKEYVLFHDPNDGSPNAEKKISVDDFKQVWGKEDFGVKNFLMVFAPQGSNLPPSRLDGAQGAMGVLNGAANVSNGFDRIFSPDDFGSFVHGIPEFFGGVFQTVGCGVGALLQTGAEWVRNLVDGVPVLRNVVEPFTDIISGVGACVADIFNGFGKAFNSVGGAFDALFHGNVGGFFEGLGSAAGNIVTGAVNAVGDAFSAVGNAISDLF